MDGGSEPLDGLVARMVGGHDFIATGLAAGEQGPLHWVVVDPVRHPFSVWQGTPTRRRVAGLDAAVATNGPMMGRRVAGLKVTREVLVAAPAAFGTLAAIVGLLLRHRRRLVDRAPFALTVAGATSFALLGGWVPCGFVRTSSGVDDRRDFDGEGCDHAWIARMSTDPSDLAIGDGDLPDRSVDGCGGLVRLLDARGVRREGDIARLAGRRGVAAWGLAPAGDPARSVVVIVGSAELDVAGAAAVMQRVGAIDAVATDPSACAFLASGDGFRLGPPRWARRRIQRYGLACGAAHSGASDAVSIR